MGVPRTLPAFALAVAALAVAALVSPPARAEDLRFEKLNRSYADFAPTLERFEETGVKVTLASPTQRVVLRDHRVRLAPLAGGIFAGRLELDVQGKGRLIADVEFGPLRERFDEEVVVPPQTLVILGKVRMRRVEGGYAVDAVELQPEIELAVQSPTLNSILALCDQAAILALGAIDCRHLDRALTRPKVPIPSGQSFTLQDADLTDDDRRAIDALIAGVPAG